MRSLMVARRACKWPNSLLRFGQELVYFGGSRRDVFAPTEIFRLPAVRLVAQVYRLLVNVAMGQQGMGLGTDDCICHERKATMPKHNWRVPPGWV
jgi:hypothetical protein